VHRFLILYFAVSLLVGCTRVPGGQHREAKEGGIHLIVEHRLVEPLDSSLKQFTRDLEDEGYAVTIDGTLDGMAKPQTIRAALQHRWRVPPRLHAAILIGEFGAPLFNVPRRQGDAYWHDHLVDLYYMDLDGAWEDTDGDGVLDRHQTYSGGRVARWMSAAVQRLPVGMDRRAPEVWVSRLRAGTLAKLGDELSLYRNYFARNHAERTAKVASVPPRAFIVAEGARSSESDWGARPGKLYKDVVKSECVANGSVLVRQYLTDKKGWALGVVGIFSGPTMHKFDYLEGEGFDDILFKTREGRRQIAEYSLKERSPWDLTSAEVARMRPNVLFYQVLSSETGRHDHENYLGGAYLFFGSGLAVIAGTQHSGAIGVPVLYDELAKGQRVGDAWFDAIKWSLAHPGPTLTHRRCDREASYDPSIDAYRAVLLGDGTLRMPR
jgi:hypothetical protein